MRNTREFTRRPGAAVARAGLFLLGLAGVFAVADQAVGWYSERTHGAHLIGREVYLVQQALRQPDPRVSRVFLGDSVARQLFPPGDEPGPELRFITSNQAISLVGQYYLLENAFASYPNLREVSLFYSAGAWQNDLDQVYTHDYFCGYFHRLDQVRDTFAATHRLPLLAAHLGRALLPNLTALNSSLSVFRRGARADHEVEGPCPDEPFYAHVAVSPISLAYLARMRRLCAEHGATFRAYPCPGPSTAHFDDPFGVYDAPFVYLPFQLYRPDRVHLREDAVLEARTSFATAAGFSEAWSRTPAAQLAGTPSETTGSYH